MASRALKIDPKRSAKSEAIEKKGLETPENVDETAIAALAYQIWLDRGCPAGSDQQDWFQAEADLKKLARSRT